MSKVLKINIPDHIQCSECGGGLNRWPDAFVSEIREHGDRVYSFVCSNCQEGWA
jgi:hypothetical protein